MGFESIPPPMAARRGHWLSHQHFSSRAINQESNVNRIFPGIVGLITCLLLSACATPAVTKIDGQQATVKKDVTPIPSSETTEDTTDLHITPAAPRAPVASHGGQHVFFPDGPAPIRLVSDTTSDQPSAGIPDGGLTIPGGADATPGGGSKVNGGKLIVPPGATVDFHRTIKTTKTGGVVGSHAEAAGKGASIATSSQQATDKFDSSAPVANVGADKNGNDTAGASGGNADISATLIGKTGGILNIFTIIGAILGLAAIGCFAAGLYGAPTQKLVIPLAVGAGAFVAAGVVVGSYPWVGLAIVIGAVVGGIGWLVYKHLTDAKATATATAAGTALASAVVAQPNATAILSTATASVASHPLATEIKAKIDSVLPAMFTGATAAPSPAPVAVVAAPFQPIQTTLGTVAPATSPTHTISTTTTSTPVAPAATV